jgi:hypothetical protein
MSKMSLAVEKAAARPPAVVRPEPSSLPAPQTIAPLVITVTDEEDDRAWLEKRVNTFAAGMRAATTAALEIARNWTKGRGVGRLYPDYPDAAAFLKDYVGTIRLPAEERDRFIVALVGSGFSRRSAAKVTGSAPDTANRALKGERNRSPREPRPAAALVRAIDSILGPKATLPDEIDRWLISDPQEDERVALYEAMTRLAERVADLKRSVG